MNGFPSNTFNLFNLGVKIATMKGLFLPDIIFIEGKKYEVGKCDEAGLREYNVTTTLDTKHTDK